MKKRIIHVSSVVSMLIMLFVVACRKDGATYKDDSLKSTTQSTLSVTDARKYFYNSLRKTQAQSVLSVTSSPDGKNRKVFPYWSHAYSSKTSRYQFIEVPVASVHQERALRTTGTTMTDAESKSVLAASFTRLILYKTKSGIINQRLITFIPDYAYLKKHNNDVSYNHIDKLDKDFSGYLEYRDWNNNLLFTLKLTNGAVVAHFRPGLHAYKQQVQSLKTADLKNKTNTDDCITYQVTVWEQDCQDFSDPDNPGSGVITICGEWYIADQYYETECPEIDCSDPANFDTATCSDNTPSENVIETDYTGTVDETQLVDVDTGVPDGTTSTTGKNSMTGLHTFSIFMNIQYVYHYTVSRGETTGMLLGVQMYDVTATPILSIYTDVYGRTTTRSITLLAQSHGWVATSPFTALLTWKWDVNARYIYTNGNPVYTRQWTKTYSLPI